MFPDMYEPCEPDNWSPTDGIGRKNRVRRQTLIRRICVSCLCPFEFNPTGNYVRICIVAAPLPPNAAALELVLSEQMPGCNFIPLPGITCDFDDYQLSPPHLGFPECTFGRCANSCSCCVSVRYRVWLLADKRRRFDEHTSQGRLIESLVRISPVCHFETTA